MQVSESKLIKSLDRLEIAEKEKLKDKLEILKKLQENHDFWDNSFFKGCKLGWFSKEDFKYIFSQYYLYSKNFTRYIAFLMANCESDYYRALLSENIWQEGGGSNVDKRHAEIFRVFLKKTLEIENLDEIKFDTCTKYFVDQYLYNSASADNLKSTTFLSLGTESIVSKMYSLILEGLLKAGIKEEELEFFKVHLDCDDEHAETIENMMLSYSNRVDWFETCLESMNIALDLRKDFFNDLVNNLEKIRLKETRKSIYKKESLFKSNDDIQSYSCFDNSQEELYSNINERLNIDFCVKTLNFSTAQVLDPRVVRIKAGKRNENHKHAHETLVYLVQGFGEAIIDDQIIPLKTGDAILFPRWSMHQVHNTSDSELIYLAVTDFEFSGKFNGIKLHDARHKK